MKLTHYSAATGPRSNSPSHVLTPYDPVAGHGGASAIGGEVRASVSLRFTEEKGDRAWLFDLTPEEARELAERLFRFAQHAEDARARMTARAAELRDQP